MPESAASASAAYVMSHTDAERRRLALQASIINPFTERLLRDAGLAGGMHVLDLGCGVGDVSLIAGRLVGAHGNVVGVDVDSDALTIAAARAKEEGLDHVRFVQADLATFEPETKCDAVTARHILIHTPDPVALIRRARHFVHAGGLLTFQEYDLSYSGPKFDDLPIFRTCSESIARLFHKAGLPVSAGSLLFSWFLEAGLAVPECRSEYLMDGGEDSIYYEWLAQTIRSLMPKLLALGVLQLGEIDLDQLQGQLKQEAVRARRPLMVGPLGAVFVRTPAAV